METRIDPDKSRIDQGYESGKGSYDATTLSSHEKNALEGISDNYDKTEADPSQENANIAKIKSDEESGIINKVVPPISKKGGKGSFAKKGGPIGIIIALLGGGSIALMMMSPVSLLIHIKEVAMQNWDMGNTSMSRRLDKVLEKKITDGTTTGAGCGIGSSSDLPLVRCKFQRPSNSMVKKLELAGISAIDDAGASVKTAGLWPNKTPTGYKYTNADGIEKTISTKEFSSFYKSDATFRAKLHAAYSSRSIRFMDSVFKKFMALFHLNKRDSTKGVTDSKTAKTAVADVVEEGDDLARKAAQKAGTTAANGAADIADGVVETMVEKEVTSSLKSVASGAKGGGLITGLLSAGCTLTKAPNLIIKVVRGYQIMLLIRFAMPFLNLADHIKADGAGGSGDKLVTPEQAAGLAGLLTLSTTKSKSGMESFGMRNLLMKDTSPTTTDGKSHTNFIPGMSITNSPIGTAAGITSSAAVTNSCSVLTNPATGLAIDAATSETVIVPVINFVGGVIGGMVVEEFLQSAIGKSIIGTAVKLAQPLYTPIKEFLFSMIGDLTANLSTLDTGNALASGVEHMLSQNDAAGYNAALTREQSVMYNEETQKVNLAEAAEDRATLSPFDVSSPNTFLGSIVSAMLPYYGNLSSVSGVLSSFGSLASSSLGSFVGLHPASAVEAQCPASKDPTLGGVAAGAFGNVCHGLDVQYLSKDPLVVIDELGASNIDPATGDPKPGSDLENWVNRCSAGDGDSAPSCTVTDSKTANYPLYSMDHRVQKFLDNEADTADTSSSSSSSSSSSTSSSISTPSGKCGDGTKDYGTQKGYQNGNAVDITTCGIVDWPANFPNSAGDKIVEVNSSIADDTVKLARALKATGYDYTASIGFRTYDQQKCIYDYYKTGSKGCSIFNSKPPAASAPGFSNHQMGYSIDVESGYSCKSPSFKSHIQANTWLNSNMSSYGFSRNLGCGDYGHLTHGH